jgi:hypothetical protein
LTPNNFFSESTLQGPSVKQEAIAIIGGTRGLCAKPRRHLLDCLTHLTGAHPSPRAADPLEQPRSHIVEVNHHTMKMAASESPGNRETQYT